MLIILVMLSLLVFAVPVRWKYGLTLGLIGAGVLVSISAAVLALGGSLAEIPLYGNYFNPIFQFAFPRMDKLSAVFVILISLATLSVTLYARDYLKAYIGKKSPSHLSLHYFSLVGMFVSMLAVVVFRGGFAFLLAWEAMTIFSFFLILFEGEKRETRRTAINYLILMHIGFVFLVVGFVAGSQNGTLGGFDELRTYFAGHNPVPLFLVFLIGFGMKAGIFPLHVWLPVVYPAAPAYVAGSMSGVMSKMGVYGMIRVVADIHTDLETIGLILLVVGMITALWGIIQAALQNDLKKLLAYSSIENMGIIFLGLGMGVMGISAGNSVLALLGISGALLHVVNHSLFKPLLFMSAGSAALGAHTRNLDELGGLSKRMPVTTTLFLIGSIAICALPPFNGFISEFLIYLGMLESISAGTLIIWALVGLLVLSLVGGLAVLVFSKAFGIGFLGAPRSPKAAHAKEVSTLMLAAQLIPLAGILLIGLFPAVFTEQVSSVVSELFRIPHQSFGAEFGMMTGLSIAAGVLIGLVLLLGWLRHRVQQRRTISESPTWGCGFTAPDARMQYTGESFSEGLQNLTNSPTNVQSRKNRRSDVVPEDEIFAGKHAFGAKHTDRIESLISGRWVYLVRKINARLALFQTGKINHYILYALLFLGLIFLISWIGWI